MSTLSDKITSYTHERGIEFNQAYTLTPTRTGTATNGTYALTNTAPTYVSNDGPVGGAGSWSFRIGNALGLSSLFRSTTSNAEYQGFVDGLFTMGFWFKYSSLPTGTTTNNLFETGSGINRIQIGHTGNTAAPSKLTFTFTGTSVTVGPTIEANRWYFVAVRRFANTTNNIEVYLDGSLLSTLSQPTIQSPIQLTFGSTGAATAESTVKIANYFHGDPTIFTSTAISEIWTAGVGANITITETPATATNAHFPEPVVSTTTGISYGTEPLTATAEISYLAVSGEVNYIDSYRQVTALLTEPTIAAINGDHVEIVTSISVSALMVNPFSVVAVINISNAADVMTASADIGTHSIIAGQSASYPADEATASAEMIQPFKFGPDSYNEFAAPMTASALMANGVGSVTASYFNLVKTLDPIYYIYDGQRNSPATVNSGNTTFTTTFDSGIVSAGAGVPLSLIGNGNAWETNSSAADNNKQITLSGTTGVNALKAMHKTRTWAYEFWLKPISYSVGSSANQFFLQNGYMYISLIPPISNIWPAGSGNATLKIEFANPTTSTITNFTIPKSSVSINNWHHLVINAKETVSAQQQIEVWIDGLLLGTNTFTFTPNTTQVDNTLSSTVIYGNTMETWFDEVAIYNSSLDNSKIIEHYNFIVNNSPNKTIFADEFSGNAEFVDPVVLVVDNNNFPATPITASQLFVDPIIATQRYINISSTPITASSLSVNPSFYGTPDYRKNAVPMTAYAEKGNNSFALDDSYYSYVQTNIAPFRYVTFDSSNPYQDLGSDNDYSVVATTVGGSITSASGGLNNKSAITDGSSYSTSGVILKESEYNDAWGTNTDHYSTSFWIQRSSNDTSSSNPRIIMNAYSAYNGHYILLYQYQNKIRFELNNGSTPSIQTGLSTINLFDYNRHQVFVNFDHSGSTHYVKVYIDSVLKETFDIGSRQILLINGVTSVGANSEVNNYPRLSIGSLIMPFGSTFMPSEPDPTRLYIDEIYWAAASLNQAGITNLYNAMPLKTNREWFADFFIGSNANLPMPLIGAGNTRIATALIANAQLVAPTVIANYDKIISATPITASALLVMPVVIGDNITNRIISTTPMIASALINQAVVIVTIAGGTMSATVELLTNTPDVDPYNLLIKYQTLVNTSGSFGSGGPYVIGDID